MPDARGPEDRDATLWVVLGVALIVVGMFFGARAMGWLPHMLLDALGDLGRARAGIGIILIGIAVLLWARSGRHFTPPPRGTRLYRTRHDKWVAGVLGGLAKYFDLDVTLLRLAFIGLVVLLDMGFLIVAYIIMAIVVPLEPEGVPPVASPSGPDQ